MKYRKLRIAWWCGTALVCVTCGCALTVWLLVIDVPINASIATGAMVALISAIFLIPFAEVLLVVFQQNNWRYSLRTLLIALTVAAIGLGWIVFALRN